MYKESTIFLRSKWSAVLCEIFVSDCSDQLPVSTKFDMRSDPGVVRNYGKLLVEMVSIVPDGIVCFFVSYSYMDGIINTWNESGLLKVKCILSLYLVAKTLSLTIQTSPCLFFLSFFFPKRWKCSIGRICGFISFRVPDDLVISGNNAT